MNSQLSAWSPAIPSSTPGGRPGGAPRGAAAAADIQEQRVSGMVFETVQWTEFHLSPRETFHV